MEAKTTEIKGGVWVTYKTGYKTKYLVDWMPLTVRDGKTWCYLFCWKWEDVDLLELTTKD